MKTIFFIKPADNNTDNSIPCIAPNGTDTWYTEAASKKNTKFLLPVGALVLGVVADKKNPAVDKYKRLMSIRGHKKYAMMLRNTILLDDSNMAVKVGQFAICQIVESTQTEDGPRFKATPVCIVPTKAVDFPGVTLLLGLSGKFPNIKIHKKLDEDLPRYTFAALAEKVNLAPDASDADIAAAVVDALINGSISWKVVKNGIAEVEPVVVEAEPASEGDQIGDKVDLHGDGIIVCTTSDEGTSIAGAYVNGPTYQERQAAANVRAPKVGGKGDSRAARRHKATGRGKKPADTGKDKPGKNKGGKKK